VGAGEHERAGALLGRSAGPDRRESGGIGLVWFFFFFFKIMNSAAIYLFH
jgi:hypothetical protein